MKIIRDGKEYELTQEELTAAYLEAEELFLREDLAEMLGDVPEPLRSALIDRAVALVRKYYFDSPARADLYWYAREDALEEATCQLERQGV